MSIARVFISYRRAPACFIARAIFQDLRANNYDVFLDVQSIDSGEFTRVIQLEIERSDHFVLVLTPETLNRCAQSTDMVLKEIQTAFRSKSNIVPFAMDTFDWGDIERFLPVELHSIALMNSVPKVSHEWFEAAMDRLRSRHLKAPVYEQIDDLLFEDSNDGDEEVVERAKAYPPPAAAPALPPQSRPAKPITVLPSRAAATAPIIPPLGPQDVAAEALLWKAIAARQAEQYDEALALVDQAIALKPNYANAYLQRALVLHANRDDDSVIAEFSRAIELDGTLVDAWAGRASVYMQMSNLGAAQKDLAKALEIAPNDAGALFLRGMSYYLVSQFDKAIADLERVVSIQPTYPSAQVWLTKFKAERPKKGWFR